MLTKIKLTQRKTMKTIIAAVFTLILAACGGGSSSDGGPGAPSNQQPASKKYQGIYSGLVSHQGVTFTDFELHGNEIKNIYRGNDLISRSDRLNRITEFRGEAYEFNDGLAGLYLSSAGSYATILYEADKVGTYQLSTLSTSELSRDAINGEWEGYYFYQGRDALYQIPVGVACTGGICNITDEEDGTIVIDFAEEYRSSYDEAGIWYGRQASGGEFVFSSAAISSDAKYLSMPTCWNSYALTGETFFDICNIATLTRK